jgi:hypothetical protein
MARRKSDVHLGVRRSRHVLNLATPLYMPYLAALASASFG